MPLADSAPSSGEGEIGSDVLRVRDVFVACRGLVMAEISGRGPDQLGDVIAVLTTSFVRLGE
jgi:hypothetical protein